MSKNLIAVCQGGNRVNRFCTHCWDIVAVRVGLIMSSMREMLPSGPWPRCTDEKEPSQQVPQLPRRTIAPDPGRYAFLLSVGPIVQRIKGHLGKKGYEAFVFAAPSGRHLALVESPKPADALYVFDADDPAWENVARQTRYEVTSKKPPQFIRKLNHTPTFQRRVTKLLAEA